MDALSLLYYGLICGALGWAGPRLGKPAIRFGIGVLVGLVAAGVLPALKAMI